MDALKQLKVGEKLVLDGTYNLQESGVKKLSELHIWACEYMNHTEERRQFQFTYDRAAKHYIAERTR